MRKLRLLLLSALLAANASICTRPVVAAQIPTAASAFIKSIQMSRHPAAGLVLTVDDDYGKPSPDTPALLADHTVASVADAYGLIIRNFGDVSALAPANMVVLNPRPKDFNAFIGMPPGDAFKLLVSSLSPEQWSEIASATGIGLSDLTTDEQRELFAAIFPKNHLYVELQTTPNFGVIHTADHDGITNKLLLTEGELAQAKIRLQKTVTIQTPVSGKDYVVNMAPRESVSGKEYSALTEDHHKPDSAFGVVECAEVANQLKHSDLDYAMPSLGTQVDTSNIVTVGDLIDRISKATHLEIYADTRYETKALAICSDLHSAPATDLLRALAFCVTGTYRMIGPAYVLSDDIIGYGTRVSTLVRFEKEADRDLKTAVAATGTIIVASHSIEELPSRGSVDFTDEQIAQAMRTDLLHRNIVSMFPGASFSMEMKLDQMSADQQAYEQLTAMLFAEDQARLHKLHPADYKTIDSLDLQGSMLLMMRPSATLIAPTVDGPVSLDNYLGLGLANLFKPSNQAIMAAMIAAGIGVRKPAPAASAPSMQDAFNRIPRRAVFAAPRTPDEVDSLIASMTKLNLNELWLDVFSDGESHLNVTTTAGEASPSAKTNILTEALRASKASKIKVVPVITLLDWGANAPDKAAELNLNGEPSAIALPMGQYEHSLETGVADRDRDVKRGVGYVDVNNLAVQSRLLATVHEVASVPEVTDIVMRATIIPGYDKAGGVGTHYGVQITPFGYVVRSRLSFLRKHHADPIDLIGDIPEGVPVSANLPNFPNSSVVQTLGREWDEYRLLSNRSLMQKLFVASQVDIPVRATNGHVPQVFIEQRTFVERLPDYFSRWDGDSSAIPALSTEIAYTGQGTDESASAYAKSMSRSSLVSLQVAPETSADRLVEYAARSVEGKGWNGFVINFSAAPQDVYAYSNQRVLANPLAGMSNEEVGK